jgi:hypothetical protein
MPTAPAREVERRRVYRRELPGAGFVAIDVSESEGGMPAGARGTRRLCISVERRASEDRRAGHEPPVLADFEADDAAVALGELYRMASDNVALARALLEWQSRRRQERSAS